MAEKQNGSTVIHIGPIDPPPPYKKYMFFLHYVVHNYEKPVVHFVIVAHNKISLKQNVVPGLTNYVMICSCPKTLVWNLF